MLVIALLLLSSGHHSCLAIFKLDRFNAEMFNDTQFSQFVSLSVHTRIRCAAACHGIGDVCDMFAYSILLRMGKGDVISIKLHLVLSKTILWLLASPKI